MDSLLIYNRIKPFVQRELQIIFEDEDMYVMEMHLNASRFILTEYISRLLSSHRYIFYPPRQPSSHETQDAQINCYNLWKRDRDFIYSKLYSLFQVLFLLSIDPLGLFEDLSLGSHFLFVFTSQSWILWSCQVLQVRLLLISFTSQ